MATPEQTTPCPYCGTGSKIHPVDARACKEYETRGLLSAAKAIVGTMHARPDIWRLMGPQEVAEFKNLCDAINQTEGNVHG